MKLKCSALIALFLAVLATSAPCAERILGEWDFRDAADTLGWKPAEEIESLKCADGCLVAVPGKGTTKLESPLFDIEASPWQYVEIEMKSDSDGTGLVYYSNTTDEPYHGFRQAQYTTFEVRGDGQYHTYKVYPFWQSLGRITHVRIDPPGKSVSVRAIRLVRFAAPEPSSEDKWLFAGTSAWSAAMGSLKVENSPIGCKLNGASDALFMSPAVEMQAEDHLCAMVRLSAKQDQTVLLRWATDKAIGLQSTPIAVKGDGLMHSYKLDMGRNAKWLGKILALGITPSDSPSPQEITLQFVAVSDKPVGPPELVVTRFGTESTFARVGQKTAIVMEVRNDGGGDARSVSAMVTLPSETGTRTLPVRRIPTLAPGQTKRFEWEFEPTRPGQQLAVCRADATDYDFGQTSTHLWIYPALDKKAVSGMKYVPEPVPADTGDYLVGAYYFPGWATYDRWQVLNDYPERRPVLGYYREGDPEVADWQINWALSHGISFFIYDWYWIQGARRLDHALHNGLFNSRYGSKFKFCLLWANHNPAGTSSEQDMMDVTKFWINNYFNKPNYLKINGKNVVVIFSTHRFSDDMGADGVKAAFLKMRKMCEDAGVGGLYIVGCAGPNKYIERQEFEGYDALSGYNYPDAGSKGRQMAPYAWMVDGYKDIWNKIAEMATVPYVPVCEAGWDARPWHGSGSLVRTGKSADLWENMLENAKAFVDDPKHKQPGSKKLVFLEAWNEFGEGDYIEPTRGDGFEYLDAVREVFAPKTKRPAVVTPHDIGMGPYDLEHMPAKTEWDFSRPYDRLWTPDNVKDVSYDAGTLRGEARNADPIIYSPRIDFDCSKFSAVEVRMRLDKGDGAQLFFVNSGTDMSEDRSVRFRVIPDNEFHDYRIDVAKNPLWRGSLQSLRLDPTSIAGARFEIAYIKLK